MPTSQLTDVTIKAALLLPLLRLMSARRVTDQTGLVSCTFNGPLGHSVVIPQTNCTMCRELLSRNFTFEQLPKSFRADGSSLYGNECSCEASIAGRSFTLPAVDDAFCYDNECNSKCCFKLYVKLHDAGKPLYERIGGFNSWELYCPPRHCGDTMEECGGRSVSGLDDGYFRGGSKVFHVLKLARQGDPEAKEIAPLLRLKLDDMENNTENDIVASMCEQLYLPEPCSAKDVDRARRCDTLGLHFTCSDPEIEKVAAAMGIAGY